MNRADMRIGVLGAGQLALMLAEAAPALGAEIVCAGSAGDCASRVAHLVEVDLADAEAVRRFSMQVDLVTLESENIDAAVLAGLRLFPSAKAVGIAQDRLLEKAFFVACGLRTAPYVAVDALEDLLAAMQGTGLPAILKTRRMGYDGKGQFFLRSAFEAETAWTSVGSVPCILEGVVPFDAEVSLIAARSASGEVLFYPLIENQHRNGILRMSHVPSRYAALQPQAELYVGTLLRTLDYTGVLAVEFFVENETLIANEMAPRVHNSGHWTIEGAATSQFENHLRAGLGLPLGSTASRSMTMLNCIGSMPPLTETSRSPSVARHDYGKQPRLGRKVGHLTIPCHAEAEIAAWQEKLALLDQDPNIHSLS